MEHLRRFELAAQLARHGADGRLEHAGEPVACHEGLGLTLPVGRGAVLVEVVEQAACLVLLDLEPGEPCQTARVVPGVDHLGLDGDRRAVHVGDDVELCDVEAQLVERLDPGRDAPAVRRAERLDPGQRVPQPGVALDQPVADLHRVDLGLQQPARLQVHQLADDVDPRDVQVVRPLAGRQPVVQVAGLRIDEVGREGLRVAPEQGVRQRHVTPVEAGQVQPHEQHRQGVDQPRAGAWLEMLAEQRPVGQGELQVPGDQRGLETLAVRAPASADHPQGLDARHPESAQCAQQLVLAVRDGLADLLDGDDPS